MLLARAGLSVLVVDRGRYGADTLSTHALMRGGVLQLARWGLLDRLASIGTPPVRRAASETTSGTASEGCRVVGVLGWAVGPEGASRRRGGVGRSRLRSSGLEGGPVDVAWSRVRWACGGWACGRRLGARRVRRERFRGGFIGSGRRAGRGEWGHDRLAAGDVALAQGAGPVEPAGAGLTKAPACVVFEGVVAGAERAGVRGGGGPAPGPVAGVVGGAVVGRAAAAGGGAGAVADLDVAQQRAASMAAVGVCVQGVASSRCRSA